MSNPKRSRSRSFADGTEEEPTKSRRHVNELKEGYLLYRLKKQSSKKLKTSYFKLAYPLLCVHDSHQELLPSTVMQLKGCAVALEGDCSLRLTLVNISPGEKKRVYILKCSTMEDAQEWYNAIQSASSDHSPRSARRHLPNLRISTELALSSSGDGDASEDSCEFRLKKPQSARGPIPSDRRRRVHAHTASQLQLPPTEAPHLGLEPPQGARTDRSARSASFAMPSPEECRSRKVGRRCSTGDDEVLEREVQAARAAAGAGATLSVGQEVGGAAKAPSESAVFEMHRPKVRVSASSPTFSERKRLSDMSVMRRKKKLSVSSNPHRTRLLQRLQFQDEEDSRDPSTMTEVEVMEKRSEQVGGNLEGGCVIDFIDWLYCSYHMNDLSPYVRALLLCCSLCGLSIKDVVDTLEDVVQFYREASAIKSFDFDLNTNLKALADCMCKVLTAPGFSTSSVEEVTAELLLFCESQLGEHECVSMRALTKKKQGFFPLMRLIGAPGHSYFDYTFVQDLSSLLSPRAHADNRRSILSQPATVIASAITIVEAHRFRLLALDEFLEMRWADKPHLAPNLVACVDAFNALSRWVASVLLFGAPKLEYQVKSFKKLVSVAEELVSLRNYNSAAAVVTGLCVTPISRLNKLSKSLSEKYSERLQALHETFQPANNYAAYRALPTTSPYLPFLAAHQRNLALIHLGNANKADAEKHLHDVQSRRAPDECTVLNIAKMRMTADRIYELQLQSPATTAFALPEVDAALVAAFENIEPLDDETLFQCSVALQPFKGAVVEEEVDAEGGDPRSVSDEEEESGNGSEHGSEVSDGDGGGGEESKAQEQQQGWAMGRLKARAPRKIPLARRQSSEELLHHVLVVRGSKDDMWKSRRQFLRSPKQEDAAEGDGKQQRKSSSSVEDGGGDPSDEAACAIDIVAEEAEEVEEEEDGADGEKRGGPSDTELAKDKVGDVSKLEKRDEEGDKVR